MFNWRIDVPYRACQSMLDDGCKVTNMRIESVKIGTIGHYGNCVCLDMTASSGSSFVSVLGGWAITDSIGFVIQVLFDLFGIIDDDFVSLDKLEKEPLRVVYKDNRAVGFGHFCDDNKFVYIQELLDVIKEKTDVGREK